MYKSVDPKTDFPKQEEEVLAFWEKNNTFKKSIAQRENAQEFVFYDGPPFATGLPHFGHFIPSTIKDIIPRYQTMKGKKVERRFGWDCHGLPVENLIETELGLNSKTDIEKYGIDTKDYDVIKGWRANASYFYIAKEFVRDNIDMDILEELLSIGDLGIQYCIKSELAYSKLHELEDGLIAVQYAEFNEKYNQRDITTRQKMRELINSETNRVSKVFSTLFKD